MEGCKEAGAREAFANRCGNRFQDIAALFYEFQRFGHPHDLVADPADICFLPDVRDIVENAGDDEFDEFFDTLLDQLPELSRKCLEDREEFMANLVRESMARAEESTTGDEPSNGVETASSSASPKQLLSLATTWFSCSFPGRSCKTAFRYEDAHRHGCFFRNQYKKPDSDNHKYIQQLGRQAWNLYGDKLVYLTQEAATVRKILEACDKDPNTTTAEEMDALKPRFALRKQTSVELVGWRGIVSAASPYYLLSDLPSGP
jgi:hypothetical protein